MKYIIVCGPTCTGKTGLGVQLALRYDGEIINADSRQMYKHTTIGTAKPTRSEMQGVKHHLFDFLELSEDFSAYQYAEMARDILRDIDSRGKLPIIVGGTGLYLKALTEGIFKSPAPDMKYRKELENIADKQGAAKLHQMLADVDPQAATRIKPADKIRLIRGLEVYKTTGKTISKLQKSGEYMGTLGNPLWIGLVFKREELYQRINRRVDNMIEIGFEQEVLDLKPFGDLIRKRKMIGYADMIAYLYDRSLSREEAIRRTKQHQRNYAKRQLTWFKKIDIIHWFDMANESDRERVFGVCDNYLKNA